MKRIKYTDKKELSLNLKGIPYSGMIRPFRSMTWKFNIPENAKFLYIEGVQEKGKDIIYFYTFVVDK